MRLRKAQRRAVVSLRGKGRISITRKRRTQIGRKRKQSPKWRTRY